MGGIMSLILQGSTSGSVTLQEPAVSGSTVLTLPAVSGTVLTTGSSGQSIPKAALPTGSVLQVVSTTKTDTFSSTSSTDVAITGLSATITPTSASSKILVLTTFAFNVDDTSNIRFNLYRNASQITAYRGDARGNNSRAAIFYRGLQGGQNIYNAYAFGNMNYLDSPASTSALTYQVYGNTNGTIFINRPAGDYNNSDGCTTASTITVMEIAA